MSYKILFILNALVAVVVGLGFLFKPDFALPVLGVTEQTCGYGVGIPVLWVCHACTRTGPVVRQGFG
ncbi:MAG: hypothetical protein M0C28_29760 [Candidatus Moduliflexus flocculans]|nr:hypothetical protein [Candidatus Moduliflexus flocculans]